jgi:hypothetical protein
MGKRKCPVSDADSRAMKQQRANEVDGLGRGGRRRREEQAGYGKVPAQPQKETVQAMRRGEHLRAQRRKNNLMKN